MPKVNPSLLQRPKPKTCTVEWTSPHLPEPVTLVCRELSAVALARCQEEAGALVEKHVTGIGDPEEAGYIEPINLPPTGGQRTDASFNVFTAACIIHRAQIVSDEKDRYTVLELVAFMQDDHMAAQISKTAASLKIKGEDINEDTAPNEAASSETLPPHL